MRTLCLIAGLAGYGAMGAAANAQPTPAAMLAPSPDASAAQQIEAAHTLQSDFVAMYFRLEAARRTAGRANIVSVPAQDDPVRIILEAQRAAPHDDSWNGTLYAIRMYEYNTPGSTSRPNPAVRWNGVVGGEVLPVIGFDPPPEKPPTPAPASAPTPPSPETPAAKPQTPAAQPIHPATPSLDELLGITPKDKPATPGNSKPTDAPAPPTGAAPDQSKADLDRLLTAQEMGDAFKRAIALMGDASTRLNDHKDPGLGTQRVQEDVVKRLDQLLASLDKQQQQQQQQSSSQQKPEPKQEPGQKKPQGQQQSQQQPKEGDGMQMHDGPTLQQGQLNPQLESARAAWGSLPARVRAMLMQGTEDRFSSRYKAMTQEYYKRLAEENSK